MKIGAIVLAAGKGKRFSSKIPKPAVSLGRKPLVIHSLEVLAAEPGIRDIVLVTNASNKKTILNGIKKYKIAKVKAVLGGPRRRDSVMKGLKAVAKDDDYVLVHDGVRPFISRSLLKRLFKAAFEKGAAICGSPVKATVKSAKEGIVKATLERKELWEIHTPQIFKKELLIKAHLRYPDIDATDDSYLVEKTGKKVALVSDSYSNIKITTREDLDLAGIILKKWNTE